MAHPLTDRLQSVVVTEPQEAVGLQVFGLRWPSARPLSYQTLDEGLSSGLLEVTEVTEGGSVPQLKVVNKGDTMAFLMAGEQLIGAKQNRVLNASIMVAARTALPVPVSCVEQGRWAYRSRSFGSHGTSSHGYLRAKMSKSSHDAYKAVGAPRADQGEVWGEVARKLDSMGSVSGSFALEQTYQDYDAKLGEVLQGLRPPEGCSGVVFAFGGRVAGVDLFDQPATLQKLWGKLVRAYALDALERKETAAPVTAEAVRRWLGASAAATAETFKSPGLGEDVRLSSPELIAASLVVEEQPVHVEMFPEGAAV